MTETKEKEVPSGKCTGAAGTDRLGTEPIGRMLFSLAAPAIAAQIINLLYNMVDRIYIGHIADIGQLALTGVGVCVPLITLISAFAALAGMGAAPRASIYLGKGDKEKAEQTLGNSVTLLFFIAITLTVLFSLFSEDLLMMFGASENTIPYAVEYMKIYCLGTLFVQFTLGLNAFITAQGFAKTSMLTVMMDMLITAAPAGIAVSGLLTVLSFTDYGKGKTLTEKALSGGEESDYDAAEKQLEKSMEKGNYSLILSSIRRRY